MSQQDYPGLTAAEWCKVHGRGSVALLARLTGYDWRTVHNVVVGKSDPSARLACYLEAATEGQLKAETLLGLGAMRLEAARVVGALLEAESGRSTKR